MLNSVRYLTTVSLLVLISLASVCHAKDYLHEGPILLQNITVLDGLGSSPMPARNVFIKDGYIANITDSALVDELPENTRVINGNGLSVLPGLIDLHIHMGRSHMGIRDWSTESVRRSLNALLYAGVTTVHDMGNNPNLIIQLRNNVSNGSVLGPRISSVGGTIERLQSVRKNVFELTSDETRREINEILDRREKDGIELIKLYAGLSPWSARHIMVEARKRSMRGVADFWCSNLSVDIFEVTMIDGYAHGTCKVIQPYVAEWMKKHGKFAMLTLTIFDSMGGHRSYAEYRTRDFLKNPLVVDVNGKAIVQDYHNHFQQLREDFYNGRESLYKAQHFGDMTRLLADNQENLRILHQHGVLIGIGTDSPFPPGSWYGEAMHNELELHVRAGVSPIDAIKMATHNGAKILGLEGKIGSLVSGKTADLLIVNGDPAKNISDTRNIAYVIKAGKLIDRDALKHR